MNNKLLESWERLSSERKASISYKDLETSFSKFVTILMTSGNHLKKPQKEILLNYFREGAIKDFSVTEEFVDSSKVKLLFTSGRLTLSMVIDTEFMGFNLHSITDYEFNLL